MCDSTLNPGVGMRTAVVEVLDSCTFSKLSSSFEEGDMLQPSLKKQGAEPIFLNEQNIRHYIPDLPEELPTHFSLQRTIH